jgi:hypothetical protein
MKARQAIASASYDPETLNGLYKAFDDAWEQIKPHVSNGAIGSDAARVKLAGIIMDLASKGARTPEFLIDAAVKLMFAEPTKLRP